MKRLSIVAAEARNGGSLLNLNMCTLIIESSQSALEVKQMDLEEPKDTISGRPKQCDSK